MSRALELHLGLVLASFSVRIRIRPVLGTMEASRQIGPWSINVSGQGKLGLSPGIGVVVNKK
jgi:hypothetical protein